MKKEIIINEANMEKIEKALAEIQGRCTARTITLKDILSACEKIEKYVGIPKKHLDGCTFEIDLNAQNFPNAYKYTPESTWLKLTFKGGKWRILDIYRGRTARENHGFNGKYSDAAKSAILEKYMTF